MLRILLRTWGFALQQALIAPAGASKGGYYRDFGSCEQQAKLLGSISGPPDGKEFV
jgi:hypothetical protein